MTRLIDLLVLLPERLAGYFAWAGPLFARFAVGWVFMWSGWGKLNNLPAMIENFRGWGIPYPEIMTPFVSGVEFVGGLLLMIGLFTRIAAVPLVVVMVVAIISAKRDQVDSLFSFLGLDETLYMALFGWLAIAGPGMVSLDQVLKRLARPAKAGGGAEAAACPVR